MYQKRLAQLIAIKIGEECGRTITWIRTRTSFALVRSFFFFFFFFFIKNNCFFFFFFFFLFFVLIKTKSFFFMFFVFLFCCLFVSFLTKGMVNSVLTEDFFLGELIGF